MAISEHEGNVEKEKADVAVAPALCVANTLVMFKSLFII